MAANIKRVDEVELKPNELMIKVSVQSSSPEDGSILYDIAPFHHPDMNLLSEDGLETMTDVLKAMCVVTTLDLEDIAELVSRYATIFEDAHADTTIFKTDDDGGSTTIH